MRKKEYMPSFLSFTLPDAFVEEFAEDPIPWGFPIGGGNTLGELTFLTKYSRRKEDGTKERWHECCRRVVEGMFTLLKNHCLENRTPWNESKAQWMAQDAYRRLFYFKWTPPGRGLWVMGTSIVHENGTSAPLQNCAFLSTKSLSPRSKYEATFPFGRLMEMSMLGVGVGFDTRGAGRLKVCMPHSSTVHHVIPDSREGWVESVEMLLASYFMPGRPRVSFSYEQIRPAGAPIKRFGGTAAGPEPLRRLHRMLRALLNGRVGRKLTGSDITDIMTMIGKCVVAGNVRRSALLALGERTDKAFLQLKDWRLNAERMGPDGWGNLANHSIGVKVGDPIDHIAELIELNGEPGVVYTDLMQRYGRLGDPANDRDRRVMGTNPCGEQSLEPNECCTLVETFPTNHTSLEDYKQTLKIAYLYAKSVTLLPTHWPESNEIMQRNRRIGTSISGAAQFVEARGWATLRTWLTAGYELLQERDRVYSEWLGVRESIKMTSVKPSGTVSLLAGVTPGVHWPVARTYIRRMRLANTDPLLPVLREAGYHVEPDVMDPDMTSVVELPTIGPSTRTEREVSVWEKAQLAVRFQRDWADNNVSVTLTFQPHEAKEVGAIMRATEGQLKSFTFLPIGEEAVYAQAPYERISDERTTELMNAVRPMDWDALYDGGQMHDGVGEKYCTTDRCERDEKMGGDDVVGFQLGG